MRKALMKRANGKALVGTSPSFKSRCRLCQALRGTPHAVDCRARKMDGTFVGESTDARMTREVTEFVYSQGEATR